MSGRDASKGRGWTDTGVFGRRVVLEALASPDVDVRRVVVDPKRVPKDVRTRLREACDARGVALERVDRHEVTSVSRDARNDQGVAAHVKLRNVLDVPAFLDTLTGAGARSPAPVLAMDGVTNPQNVGMIVRSAVGAGMRGLLWPTVGSPWITGLVIRASAGTLFRCPIVRCGALSEGVAALKGAGFSVFALDARGAQDVHDLEPAHRSLFVVGSELEGVSGDVAELVDQRVSIPMCNGVESLNAAVAASIVCFEVGAARRGGAPA